MEEDCGADVSARELRAERRRRQVLDAANTLFKRHGFHSTSMAQIAAEAGMSVGHIYRYFENKEAVIAAIVEEDLDQQRETINTMLQDPAGVRAAMVAKVDTGVAKMLDRMDAALFLEVMAEAARHPKIAESARLHHEAAQMCVGWLFEDNAAPSGRFTAAQATDLMTLVFSGLRIRAIQDPDADVVALTETVRALVSELIGAPR
jgi:AcrR family transcriptional regulator